MTQEEKRIKLAEAAGWTPTPWGAWTQARSGIPSKECPSHAELPDYFNDLNEVHELEEVLDSTQWEIYIDHLRLAVLEQHKIRGSHGASAEMRAEAIGKTLNLW